MFDVTQIVNRGTVENVVNRDLDGREFTNAQTAKITGLPRATVQRSKAASVTSVYDVLAIATAAELRKQNVRLPAAAILAHGITRDQWADVIVAEETGAIRYIVAEATDDGEMTGRVVPMEELGAHVGRAAILVNLTAVARKVFEAVLLEQRAVAEERAR